MGNRRELAGSVINEPEPTLSGVEYSDVGNVFLSGVAYAFSQLRFQRGRVSYRRGRIAFVHNIGK